MRKLATLAVVALSVLLGSDVVGQNPAPKGSTPTKVLDRPSADPNAPKRPWQVWVAHEGLRPKVDPRPDSAAVAFSQPFQFMDSYFVADRYPTKTPEYLYLVESVDQKTVSRRVGWVPIGSTCGQSALKGVATTVFRKAMIINTIESLRNDQRDGNEVALAEVYLGPSKLAPRARTDNQGARAGGFKGFQLFNIFFVFAESSDYVLLGSNQRFRSERTSQYSAQRIMQGWVHKDRLSRWNTRETHYWNTETLVRPELYDLWTVYQELIEVTPKICDADVFKEFQRRWPEASKKRKKEEIKLLRRAFEELAELLDVYSQQLELNGAATNEEILKAYEKYRSLPNNQDAPPATDAEVKLLRQVTNRLSGRVFTSPESAHEYQQGKLDDPQKLDNVTLHLEGTKILRLRDYRNPVVEWDADKHDELLKYSVNGNKLFRVGWIGDYYSAGGDRRARQKLRDNDLNLEALQQSLSQVDLLFVIDDTYSMKEYFKTVSQTVREVVADVPDSVKRLRVAVCYYNDVDTIDRNHSPVTIHKLLTTTDDKFQQGVINEVASHRYQGGGEDIQEMVFAGIRVALANCGFEPNARKIVIVIGDEGDKSSSPKTGNETLRKKHLSALYNALRGKNELFPHEFYAMQMPSGNSLFYEDMTELTDALNRSAGETVAGVIKVADQSSLRNLPISERSPENIAGIAAGELAKRLKERFNKLLERQASMTDAVAQLRLGGWQGTRIGPVLEKALKASNVDLEWMRKAKGAQVYHEGFVWRDPKDNVKEFQQVRSWVLLTENQIGSLVEIIGKLTDDGVEDFTNVEFADLYQEVVDQSVGEKGYTSLREAFLKVHAIELKSKLLQMSRTDIEAGVSPESKHELRLVRKRLEDVLKSRWRNYEETEVAIGGGAKVKRWQYVAEVTDRSRSFTIPGSDVKWYWVDAETELP